MVFVNGMSGAGESELDGSWVAGASVRLRDGDFKQVGGATVTVQWSGAFTGTSTATTNPGGVAQFATPTIFGPSVTVTVINVTHPDLTYQASSNVVSSITIVPEPAV